MSIRDRIRPVKHLQNKYFICVLEDPKDIVNIASAMRNISAFGVEKLYVIGDNALVKDFEASRSNKRLNNVSVGANKWVFVKQFDTAKQCVEHLQKDGYKIAVTSSHLTGKKNVNLYDGSFTHSKLAVWFGNESRGISEDAAQAADMCVYIPMGGIVESLNLGTSTGIVLSYISYQRLYYIFENKKARFKPKSSANQKMKSWDEFIKPNR